MAQLWPGTNQIVIVTPPDGSEPEGYDDPFVLDTPEKELAFFADFVRRYPNGTPIPPEMSPADRYFPAEKKPESQERPPEIVTKAAPVPDYWEWRTTRTPEQIKAIRDRIDGVKPPSLWDLMRGEE